VSWLLEDLWRMKLIHFAFSYTYTLCFFGRVVQKSNKDGNTHHLGYENGFYDGFGALISATQ
jgi:hypothetical protein